MGWGGDGEGRGGGGVARKHTVWVVVRMLRTVNDPCQLKNRFAHQISFILRQFAPVNSQINF